MINKLLASVLEFVGKVVVEHLKKHGIKYLIGGGAAAAGGAYVVGESVGHSKGKKEGVAEQAARDEKKVKDLYQNHENDRKRWNEERQAYEDLLDETENKL